MNKPVYLGVSILDISKTLMYEFWYEYMKLKFKEKAKLCYMDTDSFVINIFTEDFFEDINNDIEKWFDTCNYDKNDKRSLKTGINKKIIGMFKDQLGVKIIKEFFAPRAKTNSYLNDDDSEEKKAKGKNKCIIKRRHKFKDYYGSVFKNKTILRSQLRFKSHRHIVYTEEINKIAISSNDDKSQQTFIKVITYPYGTNTFKVYESELIALKNKKYI